MYLRLRQLCLVARELDPVVDGLRKVFGVEICHRDPLVGQFGLHNALLPFSTSFIEIVAPVKEGTTAGRYIDRRGGDGGYMVICDTDALPRWREHVATIDVRIAAPLSHDDYEGMQLHPRDTGGALLEINSTKGGADIEGPYWPAGPHWKDFVRTGTVQGIAGAVLQSDDPAALAKRWGQILQRPVRRIDENEHHVALDNATLCFVPVADGRGEGLGGIDVLVADRQAALANARAAGLEIDTTADDPVVMIGGVRFGLLAHATAQQTSGAH